MSWVGQVKSTVLRDAVSWIYVDVVNKTAESGGKTSAAYTLLFRVAGILHKN